MSAYKRGNTWHVRFQVAGQSYSASLGPTATKADAVAYEAKIRSEILAGKLGIKRAYSLDDAVVEWLDGEAKLLKSYSSLLVQFRSIRHLTQGRALLAVVEVAQDVKKWGIEKGWTPATINRRLAFLRRVANLAHSQWTWIDEDLGRRIKLLPGEVKRDIFLTPAEVEKLATACEHSGVATAIRLYARTGLREAELLKADTIRDGCIWVPSSRSKSGRGRLVPVPGDMVDTTLPLGISYNTLRTYFEKARIKAGMPHVRVHDLRHTAASWWIQTGASLATVRDLLGHTSFAETTRYSHLFTDDLKRASDKVAGHVSGIRLHNTCTKKE